MNKQRTIKGAVLFTMLTVMVLLAVIPQQGVSAESDLVRLTIKNNTTQGVWLKLEGPNFYYLHVPAGVTTYYTPEKGVYSYTLYTCGTYTKGVEMDLTKHKILDVPPCGTNASTGATPANTIDAGELLKLVDVTLENETDHNIVIVLYGPSNFAFFLYDGDSKEYTIPKGEYSYKIYGCGAIRTGSLFASVHKVKELTCP